MLKAVIFDMDGVIVDTEPGHIDALLQAGSDFGLTFTREYCTQFIGHSVPFLLNKIRNDYPITQEIDSFQTRFRKTFEFYKKEIDESTLLPIPGTIQLLNSLKNEDIKVAIASSSSPREIQNVTTKLQLQDCIDCYVSGLQVPESKPHPDIFLLACKELGVLPDEAIIIEDSENGTIAAHRANIPCIGFQNKNSGNQNLRLAACIVEDTSYIDYDMLLEEYNRYHGLPVEIAKTNRLTIRELSLSDFEILYSFYQNPNNTRFLTPMESLEIELEKHQAYIQHVYNFYRFGLWGVFLTDSNTLIGRCGLQCVDVDDLSEVEMGYFIEESFCRNGYALEAMTCILSLAKEYYGLPYLIALIRPDNLASIQLAEKLGLSFWKHTIHQEKGYLVYRIDF